MRVLVDLTPQVDLDALGGELTARRLPRLERRRLVLAALGRVAAASQSSLEPFLHDLEARGELSTHRGYSVVNRLFVEGSLGAVRRLAHRPEVAAIAEETESHEVVWSLQGTGPTPGAPTTSWALEAVGAPAAWRRGFSGRGVVVGIIDSGASAHHRQLAGNFRGGETSWYDPGGSRAEPGDSAYGHGTGVLSCAVGANLDGVSLGVAPAARWVACAALPEGRFNNVLMTECADWMLNIARPDVLINAWQLPGEGCDRSLEGILDAWRAAEILPVFAAGNHGPEPGGNRSPANYGGLYPGDGRSLAVGGLTAGGEVLPASSRGPSRCGGGPFPTLLAPAEDLVAALPVGADLYIQARGTSFAAGLAAGAAALLLEAYPQASVPQLQAALEAGDRAPEGEEPFSGPGRLHIPAALDHLARATGASPPAHSK